MKLELFTDPESAAARAQQQIVAASTVLDLTDSNPEMLAVRIPRGTVEGATTVIFHVAHDGLLVMLQTSLKLLAGLVDLFRAFDDKSAGVLDANHGSVCNDPQFELMGTITMTVGSAKGETAEIRWCSSCGSIVTDRMIGTQRVSGGFIPLRVPRRLVK